MTGVGSGKGYHFGFLSKGSAKLGFDRREMAWMGICWRERGIVGAEEWMFRASCSACADRRGDFVLQTHCCT